MAGRVRASERGAPLARAHVPPRLAAAPDAQPGGAAPPAAQDTTSRLASNPLPALRSQLQGLIGSAPPEYSGLQLARAEGAPDELTPEDVAALGLRGSAYNRCISERLEWV